MQAVEAEHSGRLCRPGPVDQSDVVVVLNESTDDIGYFSVARSKLAHGVQHNRTGRRAVKNFTHDCVVVLLITVVVAPEKDRNCIPVVVGLFSAGLGWFGNQSFGNLDAKLDETTWLSGDFDSPPERIEPLAHFAAVADLCTSENRIANHQQTVATNQFANVLGNDAIGSNRPSDDHKRFLAPIIAVALQSTGGDGVRQ